MSHRINHQRVLAVIGAGPKGLAVAVKAKVLREFGFPVDRVVLIEKNAVGANWNGEHGYTNGKMKLGTSPEKDVVFPIETDVGDVILNKKIRQRLMDFTWSSFLVQNGVYSDWIDRGRPAPSHQLWSQYLTWVFASLEGSVKFIKAELRHVDYNLEHSKWNLELLRGGKALNVSADGLMFTGPGKTRAEFIGNSSVLQCERVFDLDTFWRRYKEPAFVNFQKIAIVGTGENAASVLLALRSLDQKHMIEIISPRGFIATRSENFYENQIYSQPERNEWTNLEIAHRREFVERTDLGVFSVQAMQILNSEERQRVVPGRVVGVDVGDSGLRVEMIYGAKRFTSLYDAVILATGFDQVALLRSMMSQRALDLLDLRPTASRDDVASRIGLDLAIEGVAPQLHLPMLSGLRQGPGFANLSCLGRLSDRVVLSSLAIEAQNFDRTEEALLTPQIQEAV